LQTFGPISQENGGRRLNVLFTRARRKVVVITSMQPEDIFVTNASGQGPKALRDYLSYAKSGRLPFSGEAGKDFANDFEKSVGRMLEDGGFKVEPQYGVAGFFIDLVVRNPDKPGQYLAAVECDGATYHSSKSARDRDRLRQEVLEGLGWKDRIYRVWSTDWFIDPKGQSEKLLTFLKRLQDEARSKLDEPGPKEDWEDEFSVTELSDVEMDSVLSDSVEELFVDVGDVVTYRFLDDPKTHEIKIVSGNCTSESEINEKKPLAQALLEATKKEVVELEIPPDSSRSIEVLEIKRGL
jgi:very-short-patch-repair endonuclease